jgi:hypothetical protein
MFDISDIRYDSEWTKISAVDTQSCSIDSCLLVELLSSSAYSYYYQLLKHAEHCLIDMNMARQQAAIKKIYFYLSLYPLYVIAIPEDKRKSNDRPTSKW